MKRPQPSSRKPTSRTAKRRPKAATAAAPAAKTVRKPAARPSAGKSRPVAKPAITSSPPPAKVPASSTTSKQSQLIALLGSPAGASIAQMMELTGWQSHTVRGVLSGSLRKRLGLNIQHQIEDGVRVYRIAEAAAQ